jgi:hypothetical protein
MALKVEVLSMDSIPALLCDVANEIHQETVAGRLTKEDGDTVSWDFKRIQVTI